MNAPIVRDEAAVGERMLVVAGPPSAGKTSVLRALVPQVAEPCEVAYVKVDVVPTREAEALARQGWACRQVVDPEACPDHLLFERLEAELSSLGRRPLQVVETAGLCARCAPYVIGGLAIVVLEATAGIEAALKLGPLLDHADLAVVTHGDRLAPAEREVFAVRLAERLEPRRIAWFDGLQHTGLPRLVRTVRALLEVSPPAARPLVPRSAPPRLYCSLCLGRRVLPLAPLGAPC